VKLKHRLLISIIAVTCLTLTACGYLPESSFELARDSRLPNWFSLPTGLSRTDVTVTMNYYSNSSGRTSSFILLDQNKHKLAEVTGTLKGMEPFKLKTSRDGYPSYEIVTVNGNTEFVEHRKMEPIFYITDDPVVRAELGRLIY
jgi:hypothetical protein